LESDWSYTTRIALGQNISVRLQLYILIRNCKCLKATRLTKSTTSYERIYDTLRNSREEIIVTSTLSIVLRNSSVLSRSFDGSSQLPTQLKVFLNLYSGGWNQGPLGTAATNRPIVSAPGYYDDREIGGMIGRGNRTTRRKPAPVPLCPPQTPTCCPYANQGPPRWEASV
jgi:hypothetical protein